MNDGTDMFRMSSLLDVLESGDVAFGRSIQVGDDKAARALGESDFDFVMLDFEHEGFSFPALGSSLQWLISRRRMLHEQSAQARPTPLVRVPASASERNLWVIKQTLDYGPFGLVIPHVSTPDEAAWAVRAMSYPGIPDASSSAASSGRPLGDRGYYPGLAWRYWGCRSFEEYYERAALWPTTPKAELFLMILVEDVEAWENIADIVSVPGIGAVWFGAGDGSVGLGNISMRPDHPELVKHRSNVLGACKDAGVAVGTSARDQSDAIAQIDAGFDFLMTGEAVPMSFLAEARRHAAGVRHG
jgi:4-hydroxy-2-oxoheptanedioate aldolase